VNSQSLRGSQRIYAILISLYPADFKKEFGDELLYVFSEALRESGTRFQQKNDFGFWSRTLVDWVTSLFIQHLKQLRGGNNMNADNQITSGKYFSRLGLGIGIILLIPIIAMRFTDQVDWGLADFIVAGLILQSTGSLIWIVNRMIRTRNSRIWVSIAVFLGMIWVWMELAVGIFTSWGS
jgi:hypothetical protein